MGFKFPKILERLAMAVEDLGEKMADNTKALADLTQMVETDLTAAVQNAANEFAALLTAIKNNNGVNPGAIETLVTKGEALVKNLNDSVAAAQATTNPPPVVVVSVSPTSASLAVSATQQFAATVTGGTDTSVKWTAGTGSVDANGLYTAPAAVGTDTVTATSSADTSKSASASITIA